MFLLILIAHIFLIIKEKELTFYSFLLYCSLYLLSNISKIVFSASGR